MNKKLSNVFDERGSASKHLAPLNRMARLLIGMLLASLLLMGWGCQEEAPAKVEKPPVASEVVTDFKYHRNCALCNTGDVIVFELKIEGRRHMFVGLYGGGVTEVWDK